MLGLTLKPTFVPKTTPRRHGLSRTIVKPRNDLACMGSACANITSVSKIIGNYIGVVVLITSSLNFLHYRQIRKDIEARDTEKRDTEKRDTEKRDTEKRASKNDKNQENTKK